MGEDVESCASSSSRPTPKTCGSWTSDETSMSDTPTPPTPLTFPTPGDDETCPSSRSSSKTRWSASFLDYAMSVIVSRALPDVRDGLKPVHRRIIWDMEEQGFRPDRPFVKCARVTGDTMAKYHPHGDGAIYDALVRMAQPFSLRHPLIDFHGNYGSPDFGPGRLALHRVPPAPAGDAAARRHRRGHRRHRSPPTTARRTEPIVLPARFPNLLVNGSQGIAVGMATNIPPHNLGEVIDATIHLIDNPEATPDDLMQFVKGPDFPTGGASSAAPGSSTPIAPAAAASRCGPRRRSRRAQRGGYQIVVTELPYQISCSAIAGRIQELVDGGDLDGIADVNDETSRQDRHPPRRQAQARRQRQRGAQQPVQAHPAADQLRRQHGRPGRRGAAHAEPRPGAARLHRPPGRGDHPPSAVPAQQGPRRGRTSSRAASRRSTSSTQVIALIRASDDAAAAREGLDGRRSGSARCRPPTSSRCGCASSPG